MWKIIIIIQREVRTRILSKKFLFMTLLSPLLIVLISLLTNDFSRKNSTMINSVFVIDESGLLKKYLQNSPYFNYSYFNSLEEINFVHPAKECFAIIHISHNYISSNNAHLYYKNGNYPTFNLALEKELGLAHLQNSIFKSHNIKLSNPINIIRHSLHNASNEHDNKSLKGTVGIFLSILIYFFILFYSMQVMRGVIEEKSSRVIEIIITSVKPYQLMLGKILGVALVSILQFLLWITVLAIFKLYLNSENEKDIKFFSEGSINRTIGSTSHLEIFQEIDNYNLLIQSLNFPILITGFLLFFVFGYLLYSAIFAAIGSAGDHETDVQQFIFPVTFPLFLSFALIPEVMEHPESSSSLFLINFPLTSPLLMAAKLPFIDNWGDLFKPLLILCLSLILTIYVASRIYKTCILVYGQKPSYKNLWNWLLSKN